MPQSTTPISHTPAQAHKKLSLTAALPPSPFVPQRLPSLFVSHGAPSMALEHNAMTQALAKFGQNLPKPRLIVVMSAHWHSHRLELNANPAPATWHDFSGFDAALYELDYPAPANPAAAELLAEQLQAHGVAASLNPLRPYDHGVWSPLLHLYPAADVPILQLSLPIGFDSYACYQLGAMLAPLRDEQILLMGSGSLTHNLHRVVFGSATIDPQADAFRRALGQQLRHHLPAALNWQALPHAADVHPTPEHLLPLFFAAGAGQTLSVVHESFAHHALAMDIYRFD